MNRYKFLFWLSVLAWASAVTAALVFAKISADQATTAKASEHQSIPPLVIVADNSETTALDVSAPEEPGIARIIENATVTHYCICEKCCGKSPDHPAYGITASGREAVPYYSVAVDPFLIELGTILYMDFGDGALVECRADDTGSGVNGAHIDYCVSNHQEALELGVKTATVYIEEVA